MYIIKKRFSDSIYLAGIISVILSYLFFLLPIHDDYSGGGQFIINFAIAWFYMIFRWVEKRKASKEAKIYHVFLFLILTFISAWSLNRDITIFEDSADWFAILLVILCINYLAAAFLTGLPSWTGHLVSFINGVGLVTFIYLSIYLLPSYFMGIIGFFLLGLSLHVFVPLFFTIYAIVLQNRITRKDKNYWISFFGGILIPLSIIIIYILQWNALSQKIDTAWADGQKNSHELPAWVSAAENIPRTSLAKDIIKAAFVYSEPSQSDRGFFWDPPSRNIGERRKHDPLVMIATAFVPKLSLYDEDRIKLLESVFSMRHETTDRLWIGDHLFTDSVKTEVQVWPRCNMAYTEKTITVRNYNKNSWPRQEEAIYTFYMPEGSVVTSLSLWINGLEEKAILTTKARADSAYKAIVGVENRDPSVVHWQEGNTVSVRVFPVLNAGKRMFRIGITSPMVRENGKLLYENIPFKGPSAENAGEEIFVNFQQPVHDYNMPASFISKGEEKYSHKGMYDPDWGITINDPGLAGCSFSFDGNEYSLSPYHKKLSPVSFSDFYLDINQSWTRTEFDSLVNMAGSENVFACDESLVKITQANKEQVWDKLHQRSFTLFPLYLIRDTGHSLLVTKNENGPIELDDLQGSDFMKKTNEFVSTHERVKLFDLGQKLSLYLSALKEMRVLQYDNGDPAALSHLVKEGRYPDDIENDHRVVIHQTDMVIEKRAGVAESSGPDHVMRLFAYNHIMQQLGKSLLFDRPANDSLVKEANAAYVVTPVSSLVVLESQTDYDRFNIKDDANSLKNASLNSKGAVPEPREWVLIGLVLIVVTLIIRKRKPKEPAL